MEHSHPLLFQIRRIPGEEPLVRIAFSSSPTLPPCDLWPGPSGPGAGSLTSTWETPAGRFFYVFFFFFLLFFKCFLVTILVFIHRYYSMMMVKCGTGRSSGSRIRRILGSTAVCFLIFLAVPGSGFCVSAIIPGLSPAGYEGVVADRYAL